MAAAWSGTAAAQSTGFFADFTGAELPAGWETRSEGGNPAGWQLGTDVGARSEFFRPPPSESMVFLNYDRCPDCDGAADDLISPVFQLLGRSAYVEFDYFFYATSSDGAAERAWLLLADENGAIADTLARLTASGSGWRTRRLRLSIPAVQSSRLVFRYSDGGGWGRGFALDRVRLSTFAAPAASVTWAAETRFVTVHREDSVRIRVRNLAGDTLRRVVWTWQLDTLPPIREVSQNLRIAPDSAGVLTAAQPFILHDARESRLTLRLEELNGGSPSAADSARHDARPVGVTASLPPRRRLMEQFTSTACGLCPLTDYHRIDWSDRNREFIPVSIHVDGRLALEEAATWAERYGVDMLPHTVFDRVAETRSAEPTLPYPTWDGKLNETWEPAPARVYVASKSFLLPELSVEVEVEALSELSGEYRLGCLVLADTVLLVGDEFSQSNDFNGIAQDDLFRTEGNPAGDNPLFERGNPILDYAHRHVLIQAMGGADGLPLPENLPAGSRVRRSFPVYNLPFYVRADRVRLVPVLLRRSGANLEVAQLGSERVEDFRAGVRADTLLACPGDTILLSAWCTDPTATFEWSPREALVDTVGLTVRAAPRQPTTFTVKAKAGTDSLTASLRVNFDLGANFIVNRRYAPDTLTEFLFSNLTPNPDSLLFHWDFGDSTFSDERSPLHIYAKPDVYTVRLVVTTRDSACADTMTRREWVAVAVGRSQAVNQRNAQHLKIWPNPAGEWAEIRWSDRTAGPCRLLLHDVQGQLLRETLVEAGADGAKLDLRGLPAGFYAVRRSDGGPGARLLKE